MPAATSTKIWALLRWGLGPLIASTIWILPLDLTLEAHRLAGLMSWVILYWIMEPIPLPLTALLGPSFAVVLGLAPAKVAFGPFAHPLIYLFFAGFVLARAMAQVGLDRRIALTIMNFRIVAGHPKRTVLALLAVTSLLSMWLSNTATTAMMLPIAIGVISTLYPQNRLAHSTILLGLAYAASIGGLGTPVGSPPNIIAIGMLEKLAGVRIHFLQWMSWGVPTALFCLFLLFGLILYQLKKIDPPDHHRDDHGFSHESREFLLQQKNSLGKITSKEIAVLVSLLLAISLWVSPGIIHILSQGIESLAPLANILKSRLPEAVGGIIAISILFLFRDSKTQKPVLDWQQAQQIDWGSLIIFGGGLSLGSMMFQSGLAERLGSLVLGGSSESSTAWAFALMIVIFSILFTELTSNTATANMLMPLIIGATLQNPAVPTLVTTAGAAMACSLAFMLPVATPPNTVVFGSGQVQIKEMMSLGWKMNLLAILALSLSMGVMNAFLD